MAKVNAKKLEENKVAEPKKPELIQIVTTKVTGTKPKKKVHNKNGNNKKKQDEVKPHHKANDKTFCYRPFMLLLGKKEETENKS